MAVSLRSAIDDARASAIPSSDAFPAWRVVVALGRIEARRMLLHPVLLLTFAFSTLMLRALIGAGPDTGIAAWLVAAVALGLLIGVVLTANVAALRPRRDRVDELYGSLPAPTEARTAGVLGGMLLGPGVLAVLVGGLAYATLGSVANLEEYIDTFMAAQFVLSVVALGTVGVALARWVPSLLGGPLVIAAHVFTGVIWIVPWIVPTTTGIDVGWHLVYLLAVPIFWSALAFARDRRTAIRFAVAGSMFALAVLAAVLQTPADGY
ncbi:MAG: hypothetical protein WD739_10740 [Actinomycetota bacterium]